MATLMTKLVVQCPRGQRDEVFRDSEIDRRDDWDWPYEKKVRVYSYRVLSGNVLKIYSHKVKMDSYGNWKAKKASEGIEVAHFRPNQWDKVRSG